MFFNNLKFNFYKMLNSKNIEIRFSINIFSMYDFKKVQKIERFLRKLLFKIDTI